MPSDYTPKKWTAGSKFTAGDATAISQQLNEEEEINVTQEAALAKLDYDASSKTLFVSKSGSDSNDGLAPGRAKLTVAAALSALSSGGLVQIGAGSYTESALTVPAGVTIRGVGPLTEIYFDTPSSALITLTTQTTVQIQDLIMKLGGAATGSALLDMSNTFNHRIRNVEFWGQHVNASVSTFKTQVGVKLRNNAGSSVFTDCAFNNLGEGIHSDSQQNAVSNSVFNTCWKSVIGGDPAGSLHAAGISLSNCIFVGTHTPDPASTEAHIIMDGSSNGWWMENIWIEGGDKGIVVGNAVDGPASFGLVNAKVAAVTKCIDIKAARQTYMANVRFDSDPGATPSELTIDAAGALEGVAWNLISTQGSDVTTTFPSGWTYLPRGAGRPATIASAETLLNKTLTDPKIGTIWDSNGNRICAFPAVGSAVNWVNISNNSAGSAPFFQPAGSDGDIDLSFFGKGNGIIRVSGNPACSKAGVPSTATSTGTPGQIAADSSWLYICTATNTWRRVAIASW